MFNTKTRFLVTGCAGFIGSNISERLLNEGYIVTGLDNFSTGNQENLSNFQNYTNFQFIKGDIRDLNDCLIASKDIDFVLHQAALGSVPKSMLDPLAYEDNNIKGTLNIFEAGKRCKVKRIIFASSSSVYGDELSMPQKEGIEGNLLSPYALTKKVNELYGKIYNDYFSLECIGLRYFNVFGKKQNSDSQYAAVIPKFIKAIKEKRQIEIFGDGNQSRDFTYIENVIQANLKACIAPKEACGLSFNIAFGKSFTINELLIILCHKMNASFNPFYSAVRPGDIMHSLADINKAKRLLKYEPDWGFEKGLNEVIRWYCKNL